MVFSETERSSEKPNGFFKNHNDNDNDNDYYSKSINILRIIILIKHNKLCFVEKLKIFQRGIICARDEFLKNWTI